MQMMRTQRLRTKGCARKGAPKAAHQRLRTTEKEDQDRAQRRLKLSSALQRWVAVPPGKAKAFLLRHCPLPCWNGGDQSGIAFARVWVVARANREE